MKDARLSDWIATVGKVGTLPFAPGTWGSLVALIAWFLIHDWLTPHLFIVVTIIIFIVGVITSTIVEKNSSSHDPSRVVIDEWVGQWVALAYLPKTIGIGIAGFLLFRLFDIWKPWPIRKLDEIPNGWGIMLDDVGAGLFALIIIQGYLLL